MTEAQKWLSLIFSLYREVSWCPDKLHCLLGDGRSWKPASMGFLLHPHVILSRLCGLSQDTLFAGFWKGDGSVKGVSSDRDIPKDRTPHASAILAWSRASVNVVLLSKNPWLPLRGWEGFSTKRSNASAPAFLPFFWTCPTSPRYTLRQSPRRQKHLCWRQHRDIELAQRTSVRTVAPPSSGWLKWT